MIRRPRDTGKRFSLAELAIGAGMTKRAVQIVADEKLIPEGSGVRALKRVAGIGGFVAAGVPLMVAARLVEAMRHEFAQDDGEIWSGFERLVNKLIDDDIRNFPLEANDYHSHQALRRRPNIYQPGRALKSDALVEIVDRSLVFLGSNVGVKALTLDDEDAFLGWIEGWERGGAVRIIPVHERIELSKECGADERNAIWSRYARKAQQLRGDAVGKLTVNVSLGIRIAFDRIANYREASKPLLRDQSNNVLEDW